MPLKKFTSKIIATMLDDQLVQAMDKGHSPIQEEPNNPPQMPEEQPTLYHCLWFNGFQQFLPYYLSIAKLNHCNYK